MSDMGVDRELFETVCFERDEAQGQLRACRERVTTQLGVSRQLNEWIKDRDLTIDGLGFELAEAEAEIARHHELIVKMRELLEAGLHWAQHGQLTETSTMRTARFEWVALVKQLLKREVG